MKKPLFASESPPDVRRPTIAPSPPQSLIFGGWGPRLNA